VTVCCSSSFVRCSSFVVRRSFVRRRRSFSSSFVFVVIVRRRRCRLFVVVGDGRVPVVVVCEFVSLSHSFIDGLFGGWFVWWARKNVN